MKLVTAYIRPESLGAVKEGLYAQALYGISVTNILGSGRQKGYTEIYRGVSKEVTLLKKVRIELYLNDEDVDKAVAAIMLGARTGKQGDGMIYISDVQRGYRIRTGESL